MSKKTTARALIALNVRTLRIKAQLSQEKLAEQCGLHRTFISQLETERSNVTIDNLERIAHVLKVPVGQLLHSL